MLDEKAKHIASVEKAEVDGNGLKNFLPHWLYGAGKIFAELEADSFTIGRRSAEKTGTNWKYS